MSRFLSAISAAIALNAASFAAVINVPNFSFESPTTTFATPFVDSWERFENEQFQVGLFINTPVGMADHIDNVEGSQVGFIFASQNTALFQDLTTPDAVFAPGLAYQLQVNLWGGGSLLDNSEFLVQLYYRDAQNVKTVFATRTVVFDSAIDPNPINHLFEQTLITAIVQPSDPWANKQIGIQLAAGVSYLTPGFAYWDVDNVRLSSVPEPTSVIVLAIGAAALLSRGRRNRRCP
jgi:hypothetical protein